mmetsp:Transcript_29934/g.90616  ORF Transcript_29934/g.90616 Transcript_29934/m.90616 type:complete len:259 (-) Transcript_29934:1579-2355(-)
MNQATMRSFERVATLRSYERGKTPTNHASLSSSSSASPSCTDVLSRSLPPSADQSNCAATRTTDESSEQRVFSNSDGLPILNCFSCKDCTASNRASGRPQPAKVSRAASGKPRATAPESVGNLKPFASQSASTFTKSRTSGGSSWLGASRAGHRRTASAGQAPASQDSAARRRSRLGLCASNFSTRYTMSHGGTEPSFDVRSPKTPRDSSNPAPLDSTATAEAHSFANVAHRARRKTTGLANHCTARRAISRGPCASL